MNMSYCRFQNTEIDLNDCLDTLRSEEKLSEDEQIACRGMFMSFLDFCYDKGIIDDINGIDEKLDKFMENFQP